MAYKLTNMLGHMMRPKQQAVAIASNNTDQMMFGSIAPVSPTMQAQQQRLAAAFEEQMQQQHQSQAMTTTNVSQQRPHTPRIVTTSPVRTTTTQHQNQQQHQNLYALPQMMATVPSHRQLLGPVYATAMQNQTQVSGQNASSAPTQSTTAAIPSFYLPQAASEVNSAPQLNFQHNTSQSVGQLSQYSHQQGAAQGPWQGQTYNPYQQQQYGQFPSQPMAYQGGRPNFNVTPVTSSHPVNQNQRNNTRGRTQQQYGKTQKIEQLYFKNEAEAQAWEDQCLDSQLEAPAPKQFLQNVAPTNNSKKNAKQQKAAQEATTDASVQKPPGEQSFKMKFKTEICKFWQQTGACEYNDQCSFAHGSHELKQRTDQPRNYKTKQCKRFHKELYCPYGARCQFLHDEAPSKKQLAAQKSQPTALPSTQDSKVNVEGSAAAAVSYTDLLNSAIETDALAGAEAAVDVDESQPEVDICAIDALANRRLRVFADIPDCRSDSLISLE